MFEVLFNQFERLADKFLHTLLEELVTILFVRKLADGFQRDVIVLHMEILF